MYSYIFPKYYIFLGLPTKYLLCFSLHANAKRLFRPDTEKDSIKIFHGMRVLTTLWVIAVHSCFYQNYDSTGEYFMRLIIINLLIITCCFLFFTLIF